jgi:predicted flap endonuclease-1-like 5' DNA nuclease
MAMDRSTRTLIASFLWVAAVFVAMNTILASTSLGDWALFLILAVVGAVVVYLPETRRVVSQTADVEAGIGAAEWRSDALAAAVVPHVEELEDAVENISSTAVATLEEVDALSGPPTDSRQRNPAAEVPAVATPVIVRRPAPETPAAPVSISKASAATHEEEIVMTESRSDEMASVAEPSTEELEDNVDNVSTMTASTLEETEELSGPPTDSQPRNPRSTSEMPRITTKSDDLTVIEGIGPKMSAALIAAGIDTYAKLAVTNEDTLRGAITTAGMRFAPSLGTWAEQATFAAKGDWDGLKTFISSLNAGRRSK